MGFGKDLTTMLAGVFIALFVTEVVPLVRYGVNMLDVETKTDYNFQYQSKPARIEHEVTRKGGYYLVVDGKPVKDLKTIVSDDGELIELENSGYIIKNSK